MRKSATQTVIDRSAPHTAQRAASGVFSSVQVPQIQGCEGSGDISAGVETLVTKNYELTVQENLISQHLPHGARNVNAEDHVVRGGSAAGRWDGQ